MRILAFFLALTAEATEPKPGPIDWVRYSAELERRLAYREPYDRDRAVSRLKEIVRLSGDARIRSLRDRMLFAYPSQAIADFAADLPGETPVDVARQLHERLAEEPATLAAVRGGYQRYLERLPSAQSDDFRRLAHAHFAECPRTELRMFLCQRRTVGGRTLSELAGRRRIVPTEAEWEPLPAACRERFDREISCDFPAPRSTTSLPDFLSCRDDDDCVAIKNGCGIKAVVGSSSAVHDRHRCECVQGPVIRGCFPVDKPAGDERTEN